MQNPTSDVFAAPAAPSTAAQVIDARDHDTHACMQGIAGLPIIPSAADIRREPTNEPYNIKQAN
jgi:hypothetical protein